MDLLLNIILDFGLLAVPIAYVKFFEKKEINLKEFGLEKKNALPDAILTSKIFLTLFIYSIILSLALLVFGISDFQGVESALRNLVAVSPLLLIYLFIVRVFLEEFFFRAFLVPRTGVVVSSVIFGALHFGYGSIGEIIGAVFLGMILAISYKENNRLMPNFLAHLLYNMIAVLTLVAV